MPKHAASSFVEPLESRQLFAGASIVRDMLVVTANAGATTNTVDVVETADGSAVDVSISSVTRRGVAKQFTASFPKSLGYTRVVVRGGAGADTIEFRGSDDQAGTFSLPVRVNGRAGNDTIRTGAADDLVAGGRGDDVITTFGGNDTVHAQAGMDTVVGGSGDDVLWGGAGDDRIEGNDGNDKLGGILGGNTLLGGDGADEFVVRTLDANPGSDFTDGTDTLTIVERRSRDEVVTPVV